MSSCPFLAGCPFFNDKLANMPMISGYLKLQFCNDRYAECARYLVRTQLGPEHVPGDMFPNEPLRAHDMVQRGKTAGAG